MSTYKAKFFFVLVAVLLAYCAPSKKPTPHRSASESKTWSDILKDSPSKSAGREDPGRLPHEDVLLKAFPPLAIPKTRLCAGNVAVSLVIDKSHGVSSKITSFKNLGSYLISALKNGSELSILAFDANVFKVLPLVSIDKESRKKALERINVLFPYGSTNLLPALEEARRELMRSQQPCRHIVILTDGKLPDAGAFYLSWARQVRLLGVHISVAMLGEIAEVPFMQKFSTQGGGITAWSNDPLMYEEHIKKMLKNIGNF